jgi:hypothetical protein
MRIEKETAILTPRVSLNLAQNITAKADEQSSDA